MARGPNRRKRRESCKRWCQVPDNRVHVGDASDFLTTEDSLTADNLKILGPLQLPNSLAGHDDNLSALHDGNGVVQAVSERVPLPLKHRGHF